MAGKHAKPSGILLVAVLDRSGSMEEKKADVEGGWAQFIADQRLVPGEMRVSLHQFDNVYETVYRNLDVHDIRVARLRLEPRNLTRMNDAIGRTITDTDRVLDEQPAESVIVMIMTDGRENDSREYSTGMVRSMIADRERQGWKFLFLGEGRENVLAGRRDYGLRTNSSMDWQASGGAGAMAAASSYMSRGRSAGAGGQAVFAAGFTPDDEEAAREAGESK